MTRFEGLARWLNLLGLWTWRHCLVPFLSLFFLMVFLPQFFPTAQANSTTQERGNKKILIVGDSLSAGYGIPQGKGWVSLLQKQIERSHPTLEIVNDSISGDTTAGGLARLDKALTLINPDWVVIALGGNDGLRGQSLKAMSENLTNMIALSREHGSGTLLLGMKLPPNYGKQYILQFEKVYEKVAMKTNTPLLPFYIEGVGGQPGFMQEDRIHPNTQAQGFIQKNVWQFMEAYVVESDVAVPDVIVPDVVVPDVIVPKMTEPLLLPLEK